MLHFAIAPLRTDDEKKIFLNAIGDVCQTLWDDAGHTDSMNALNALRSLCINTATPRDWAQLEQAAKSPRQFSSWSALMVFLQFGAAPLGRIIQKAYNVPEPFRPAMEALAMTAAVIWRLEKGSLYQPMSKGLEKLLLQTTSLHGRNTIADPHLRAFVRRLRAISHILCRTPNLRNRWSRWQNLRVFLSEVFYG